MNGYTSHGHPIPGATIIAGMRPTSVARCGGPRMCTKCAIEAAAEQRRFSPVDGALIPTDTPDPVHTAARRLLAALTDKPSTDGMTELAAAITALRDALGKDAS